ncbi:MAG TPA: hypothetical protein VMB52_00420 [Verrucomicrobiae bacterium]|nr:hypothetical protein [Verrucomicrobiae bacterium]
MVECIDALLADDAMVIYKTDANLIKLFLKGAVKVCTTSREPVYRLNKE